MFSSSVLVIFILGCIILVIDLGSSDGKILLVNDGDSKFQSETTITPIPSDDALDIVSTVSAEDESYDKLKNKINSNYGNYFVDKIPITSDREIDDLKMCDSVVQYIKPLSGLTVQGISKYIINMGQNYSQEIRMEKCIEKNSTCNYVKDVVGYKSYCKQAYTYQRMLSVDTSYTNISVELFKIPSGCICASKQL